MASAAVERPPAPSSRGEEITNLTVAGGGDGMTPSSSSSSSSSSSCPKRKRSNETFPPTMEDCDRSGSGGGATPPAKRIRLSNAEEDASPSSRMDDGCGTEEKKPDAALTPAAAGGERRCFSLPSFPVPATSMWTSSHEANAPSEDRHASLVNILLKPIGNSTTKAGIATNDAGGDEPTSPGVVGGDSIIRVSLWCILDGHGGGCVAAYASEVLLPHIAVSVAEALRCTMVSHGELKVNGESRSMEDMDLDNLLVSSMDAVSEANPFSVNYRAPELNLGGDVIYFRPKEGNVDGESSGSDSDISCSSDEEDDAEDDGDAGIGGAEIRVGSPRQQQDQGALVDDDGVPLTPNAIANDDCSGEAVPVGASPAVVVDAPPDDDASASECSFEGSSVVTPTKEHQKPSIKSKSKRRRRGGRRRPTNLTGTHSPTEVSAVSEAITRSFLSVDEGWMNSIDSSNPQLSCIAGGRWNVGSCALVLCSIQRLDLDRPVVGVAMSPPDDDARDDELDEAAATSAAISSREIDGETTESDVSSESSSSLPHWAKHLPPPPSSTSSQESGGCSSQRTFESSGGRRTTSPSLSSSSRDNQSLQLPRIVRSHDAMLYTAHCGDCRAVMGTDPTPPLKFGLDGSLVHEDNDDGVAGGDNSDNEQSDDEVERCGDNFVFQNYMSSSRTSKRRSYGMMFSPMKSGGQQPGATGTPSSASSSSPPSYFSPPSGLFTEKEAAMFMTGTPLTAPSSGRSSALGGRPSPSSSSRMPLGGTWQATDLTTDHSAYNPTEVELVLRRCNNAPRAISSANSGGIKRVAGSLAVTRALGDAYLKEPSLSFFPYKKHAPYISGQPEISTRLIRVDRTRGAVTDRFVVMASDGLWERADGNDALRWMQSYFNRDGKQWDRAAMDRRLLPLRRRRYSSVEPPKCVSQFLIHRVLNKIRKAKKLSSLAALMALPRGRARRTKHDDITVTSIDLSGFVSL